MMRPKPSKEKTCLGRSSRMVVAALIVSSTFAPVGQFAEAQSPTKATAPIPVEIQGVLVNWAACRGKYVGFHAKDNAPPETIANAALAACGEQEKQFEIATRKAWGEDKVDYLTPMRDGYRKQMTVDIQETRRGSPSSDPAIRWGTCVGNFGRDHMHEKLELSALADRAFASCLTEQNKVEAGLVQQFGPAQAHVYMREGRAQIQANLIRQVGEVRKTSR